MGERVGGGPLRLLCHTLDKKIPDKERNERDGMELFTGQYMGSDKIYRYCCVVLVEWSYLQANVWARTIFTVIIVDT